MLREEIGGRSVLVEILPEIGADRALLDAEKAEFEAVFGAPVQFSDSRPGSGPRWVVDIDSSLPHSSLHWDRATLTLTSVVPDALGWMATFQLLHSLVTLESTTVNDSRDGDLHTAMPRVSRELSRGFPGFEIRSLS